MGILRSVVPPGTSVSGVRLRIQGSVVQSGRVLRSWFCWTLGVIDRTVLEASLINNSQNKWFRSDNYDLLHRSRSLGVCGNVYYYTYSYLCIVVPSLFYFVVIGWNCFTSRWFTDSLLSFIRRIPSSQSIFSCLHMLI